MLIESVYEFLLMLDFLTYLDLLVDIDRFET